MNDKHLSKRLLRVANYVPKGATIADIGSDHAYLPCYLCLQDQTRRAIAGELNEGPYQSARNQVRRSKLNGRIDVRKGNGLAVITKDDRVEVVTIAGMGGGLIASILEEGKKELAGVQRLVLQPNVAAIHIREWLYTNDWRLIDEDILCEDGKIYEIVVAERGIDHALYEHGRERKLLLGPYLSERRGPTFLQKWSMEAANWHRVLRQIGQAAPSDELSEKKQELNERIKMVEEVLSWEKKSTDKH